MPRRQHALGRLTLAAARPGGSHKLAAASGREGGPLSARQHGPKLREAPVELFGRLRRHFFFRISYSAVQPVIFPLTAVDRARMEQQEKNGPQ
eukprot:6654690-Pyramimonas_sp.AAC.1